MSTATEPSSEETTPLASIDAYFEELRSCLADALWPPRGVMLLDEDKYLFCEWCESQLGRLRDEGALHFDPAAGPEPLSIDPADPGTVDDPKRGRQKGNAARKN